MACSWLLRSTMFGIPFKTPSIFCERPRSTARSGPKSLTARFVLLPEIMWSIRWLMGWPKLTLTPGIMVTARRISASTSSLGRPGTEHHLHLRGIHTLDVLVLLRATGAAAGGDDLGKGEQRFFHLPAKRHRHPPVASPGDSRAPP